MYRHELFKVFTRKNIYIVFFLVVLTMVYIDKNYISQTETMEEDEYVELFEERGAPVTTMKNGVYEKLFDEWGGPVTEDKISLATEKMQKIDEKLAEGTPSLTPEEKAAYNVHFIVANAGQHEISLQERKETLHSKIDDVDDQSYAYKEAEKELSMLEQLDDTHGFYLIRAWRGMFDLIEPFMSVILLSTLILLGLTPIFAEEHSQGTLGLILATKHGKGKLVTAKIMASLTYIGVIFSSLHLVNFFLHWLNYGGLQGWNAPIQSLPISTSFNTLYELSPFAWDVWQYYAITLSIQFLACVALAFLVLLISMLVKNVMFAFFISGAVIGAPFMFRILSLDQGIFKYINSFSYLEFMKVDNLFQEFIAYNVFGYPVLYPLMLLFIFVILTAVIVFFTYNRFRHQQVNE